jgi:DNA polymerase (family 10)
MQNERVAQILDRIADYMEMNDDFFRVKAYRRAANTIENLSEDIEFINKQGKLQELPGIGKHIAKKIAEILETGSSEYFEKLKKEYPVDFDVLLSVEGMGPKTIKLLYEELGVENLDDLEHHAKRHHIRRIKGMGDKKEKKILENIEFARKNSGRKLLGHILPLSEELRSKIAALDAAEQVELAGSIRRRKETVGDIDVLVITKKPQEIMDFFTEMESVDEIIVKGPSKSTVILKQGLDCDLRVFENEIFGAALLYFTGSKELNVELRKIAISKGMKLSEYGLFKGIDKVAGKTEKEIFNALGLDYIPPELRESRGEVDAAREGKLPELVDYNDIKGDLEVHSNWSDGENTIEEMALRGQELGYEYLAITDHSGPSRIAGGIDEKAVLNQIKGIDKLNDQIDDLTILKGLEVNIGADEKLDINRGILEELDIVVGSVHSGFKQDFFEMTSIMVNAMQNENIDIIAHPTGRKIQEKREYDLNLNKILEVANETNTFLEINSHPNRLDLRDVYVKRAIQNNCKLVINTDAHSKEQLSNMHLGIATARRGWAEKKDIVNTLSLKKLLNVLNK